MKYCSSINNFKKMLIYSIIILFIISLSSIYFYQQKIKYFLISILIHWIGEMDSQQNQNSSFKIHPNGKSATIKFKHLGKYYQVHVPYNKKLIRKMAGSQVQLIKKDDEPIDITQKPGIPYLVSAEHFDGKHIIWKKFDQTYHFKSDSIPFL